MFLLIYKYVMPTTGRFNLTISDNTNELQYSVHNFQNKLLKQPVKETRSR